MITLDIGFGYVDHQYIDFGFFQEPALGGEVTRVDRPGGRYAVSVSAGPFRPDKASQIVSDLIAARSEGLRIPYPLQQDQGSAGAPVIDGAGQTGTVVNMRGFAPGYVARKGYWLSIEDENGNHSLHNVRATVRADAAGDATLSIVPELKRPYADGDKVHFSKPMIEGWPIEDMSWQSSVQMSVPIMLTIREAI